MNGKTNGESVSRTGLFFTLYCCWILNDKLFYRFCYNIPNSVTDITMDSNFRRKMEKEAESEAALFGTTVFSYDRYEAIRRCLMGVGETADSQFKHWLK